MQYVPGPMFGQFSGSQGNTTASHNRYTSYVRNRVVPVNPSTPDQTAVRAEFTNYSQNWRNLTQAEQNGWTALAILDPGVGPLGQPKILSGSVYYNGFNIQRASVGLVRLDVAPALVEVPPSVIAALIQPSGGTGIMDYTPTTNDGTATNFQLIRATAPLSNGINFVGRSLYKNITSIAGDAPLVPPEDLSTTYEAVFGTGWQTSIGMKIGFRVCGVSDSGFTGAQTDFLVQIGA